MSLTENEISQRRHEACAIMAMQRMLEKYSEKSGISIDEAIEQFADSNLYSGLFDYATGLWGEGPDYLMAMYEIELKNRPACNSDCFVPAGGG